MPLTPSAAYSAPLNTVMPRSCDAPLIWLVFMAVTLEASTHVSAAFVVNITPKPEVADGLSWPSPGKTTAPADRARPLAASWIMTCAVTLESRLLTCDSAITPPVELTLRNPCASDGATKSVTKLEVCDQGPCVLKTPLTVCTRQ